MLDDFEEGVELVYAGSIAGERGRKIETKTVHVHLAHPITQTVHYDLQRARMQRVERVAGTGVVEIEARLVCEQSIIRSVVDPAKAQRRAEMISFDGVIVNHVENDFDPDRVETAHH